MQTYFIGIAGGTGSGKSTFANLIKEAFPDDISLISYDNYYREQGHLSYEERCQVNYDCPDALETEMLVQHLRELKEGKEIDIPVYDFTIHNRSTKTVKLTPKPVVIVDGILTFCDKDLRDLFDLKIFVQTDADERILRRVKRDMETRGRSIDSVIEQYLTTVKPMHNLFVEPEKDIADIIINGGLNERALHIVLAKIEQVIKSHK